MTDLTEIIARAIYDRTNDTFDDAQEIARDAISALSTAGYVIVPRDTVSRETLDTMTEKSAS